MSNRRVGKKISNVFVHQEPSLQPKQTNEKSGNAFQDMLKSVGYTIGHKNDANELDVDQAVFVRDLTKLLTNERSPQIIEKFISGFEAHLEDEVRLKWSLMPTITTASCETARNASQDSLIHLLLNIEAIQEKVASIMLDKLAELSYSENSVLYDRAENKSVACLIVSQFRWLNKLVNSEALTDKLIELIEATPLEVQKDIIKLLPDVISEYDHSKVARSLGDLLRGNQELNVTILDALTNLNIDSEMLSEIRKREIDIISSANISDLPLIVKFILQDLTSAETTDTINELRKNLDFNSTFSPIISSTPINPKVRDSPKDIASCVLNTIKHSLKFQKSLCDAWIKVLEFLQSVQNHKSLDILVILILLSLEINEKKLENIIKNKIRIGDINEDLLHVTFRCHHEIIQEYAPILIKVAENLLRSNETSVSIFGCSLYIKCFVWFDTFYKQEVIGNLITHVGNKSENEINAALDTLLCLVQQHTQKMAPYSLFVKTLIDHLDNLTLNQIRKVHETLSILAYQGGREGSMLLDDILIVIRKQLASKNLRYRKMGVIGALMAAKTAAAKENDEYVSDVSVSSDILDNTTCYQHSLKLLDLVFESTADSNEAFALFCDELSLIMLQKKIGKTVLEWVGERILSEFEDYYIIDIKPEEYEGKDVCPRYALDEVNEPVALNLYGIILKNSNMYKSNILRDNLNEKKKKSNIANESRMLNTLLRASQLSEDRNSGNESLISPIKLSPVFRLLRIFKQIQDGNLDSIDALLGCSIILPELRFLKINTLTTCEQHLKMNTLFYCVNWIRENINAFATFTDDDIRCNVLTRLQLLVDMEELICNYISSVQDYSPPIANFDSEGIQVNGFKLLSKKAVKRNVKNKKKSSKKVKVDEDTEQTVLNGSKSKLSNSEDDDFEPKNISDLSILKKLQPYFREFDFDVFSLLSSEITFISRPDVFSNEKVTSLKIHPKEVKFLLEDLFLKLNYCFNSSAFSFKIAPKKVGFSNLESLGTEKVIVHCINLLPSLCNLLEACATYFKNLAEECDGVEDSLLIFTDDSQRIMDCMNLIFKSMNQIISWKNFSLNENVSFFKKILHIFSSRLDATAAQSLSEMIGLAVNYFNLFTNALPSLVCAGNLMQLLTSFLYFSDDMESKNSVSTIALNFLKKSWPEVNSKYPKTAIVNENVKILLDAYLTSSKVVLKSLEYLAAEAIPQMIDEEGEKVFSTLTKSSLICYYKMMFHKLSDYMKVYFSKKVNDSERLLEWSIAFKIFQVLTNLLKTFGSRSYISICLKCSREFMATFLKHGMPFMDKMFISNKEDIICLMKTLQVSTRYLQHVCSHSKVVKDVALISHVPFLKKNLEIFVFRVKMMLAVHKCEEAFWLGNLKNRDIKGAEILSQSQEDSEDDSEPQNNEEEINENKSDSEASGIGSEVEESD